MILTPAPVSTKQFTWDRETNTFVAEMSDTNGFGHVYDDACDEGLTLVSAWTGQEVVFVVDADHRDAEGEITHWDLVPVRGAAIAGYKVPGSRVTIFND